VSVGHVGVAGDRPGAKRFRSGGEVSLEVHIADVTSDHQRREATTQEEIERGGSQMRALP